MTSVSDLSAAELLEEYADLIDERTVTEIEQRDLEDGVLTPEQRTAIAEIKIEFAPQLEAIEVRIAEVALAIKAAALRQGETVKSDRFMAVYVPGRVTWDAKALDGYAAAHREIRKFRSEGKPSITLRSV